MTDSQKIKNNIIFKIWDIFILLLVLVAIFMLIQSYFILTPEIQEATEKYNYIVSSIFLLDVLIRLILFRKEYLFSTEIIIDVLACSDLLSPAMRAIRGIKYARLLRILRILRMLRIFRALKAVKHSSKSLIQTKLFNSISIILILSFIILSTFISNYISNKFEKINYENYKKILASAYVDTKFSNKDKDFDVNSFIKKMETLSNLHNLISYSVKTSEIPSPIEKKFITDKEKEKIYFPNDLTTVSIENPDIQIKAEFAVKGIQYHIKMLEMLILVAALPLLVILLFIVNFIITKYFVEPIAEFQKSLSQPENYSKIKLPKYFSNTILKKLEESYNKSMDFYADNRSDKGGDSE